MGLIDWFGLVVLSVLWGSSFLFVELAVDHLPSFTIVFLRVGLAALALVFYCAIRKIRIPLGKKYIAQYAVMGFFCARPPLRSLCLGANIHHSRACLDIQRHYATLHCARGELLPDRRTCHCR